MKATQVSHALDRINIRALPADAQRSLAQRVNAWAKANGIELETPAPAARKVAAPLKPIKESKPMPKPTLDIEAIVTRAVAEVMASINTEPTPIKRAPKAKANTFYEDVIVGGYAKRAEAKPYKCMAEGCYKQGHRFTKAGWFGTSTTQGHLALAARYHR